MNLLMLLVMVLEWTSPCQSYNILGLFPHPGLSHFHFFHPILRGLAEAGHDVTVISHFPDKNPLPNYKDLILTHGHILVNNADLQRRAKDRNYFTQFKDFFLHYNLAKEACNQTYHSAALEQVLHQKKRYDVVLMELYNTDCMTAVAHVLCVPAVALSSSTLLPWHFEPLGYPILPSYIPSMFMDQSEEMDFMGRIGNWISFHLMNLLYKHYIQKNDNEFIRKKFGPDMPDAKELAAEISLVFVNQHYTLTGATPLPPAVIEIGGIHIQKAKPLDHEIQRYLDTAEHGVILISWGSRIRADTLCEDKRESIIKALKRLNQKVLWKWENDTLLDKPSNVLIRKWLPQREILCHPNVKVFMTHGGLLGATEAVYCGVPVIVTPVLFDQFLNAAHLVHRGMGTILKYNDIAEDTVFEAITQVLQRKFMDNAKSVSLAYRDRPRTPLETAIWWVEHVIETNGAPLIKSVSSRMPIYVYHSFDVWAFFAAIIFFMTITWRWLIKRVKNRQV